MRITVITFLFFIGFLSFVVAGDEKAFVTSLKDCDDCPELVVVPQGSFIFGREPVRPKNIKDDFGMLAKIDTMTTKKLNMSSFAIGKYEVTYGEYMACFKAGGCTEKPMDKFGADERLPAVGVTWHMAQDYVQWLSDKTGRTYRLPSAAEWEYAAKAGTHTPYWWGIEMEDNRVLCRTCFKNPHGMAGYNSEKGTFERPYEVGYFPANPFGLHDMLSNVGEWVQDCVFTSVQSIPEDGSAYEPNKDCKLFSSEKYEKFNGMRTIRGAHYKAKLSRIIVSRVSLNVPDFRRNFLGFRVVAEVK